MAIIQLNGAPLLLSAIGQSSSISLPMKTQCYQGQSGYSLLVNFSSGASLTASVQVSNDPNAGPSQTAAVQNTARWNLHDTLNGLTGSKNSSIVFPVAFVRLVCTAWTSGTVTLDIGGLDYLL